MGHPSKLAVATEWAYTGFTVKIVRQLASFLVLVISFALPAMSCLVPGVQMTDAERDCCEHMAQQCGSTNMPFSHSCCHKELTRQTLVLNSSFAQLTASALGSAVVTDSPYLHIVASEFSLSELHPPPESPPSTSSILKI